MLRFRPIFQQIRYDMLDRTVQKCESNDLFASMAFPWSNSLRGDVGKNASRLPRFASQFGKIIIAPSARHFCCTRLSPCDQTNKVDTEDAYSFIHTVFNRAVK